MKKRFRYVDLVLTTSLFLLALLAQRVELFSLAEDQTVSARHLLRTTYGDGIANKLSPAILLVNTDEAFFKAYGSFPLRRSDIGRIAENLTKLGAKVVAIDSLMDFPSSYGEDPVLAESLDKAGNALLVAQAEVRDGHAIKVRRPTPVLDEVAPSGYTNITSASALVTQLSRLRMYPELATQRGGWPFAVAATAMYLGVEPRIDGDTLRLGDIAVPLDRTNSFYIDFPPLPSGTRFLTQSAGLSALEFIDLAKHGESDLMELEAWVKDRIVLVGDTSEVSHDWFNTPAGMVHGVEIIADTVNTLLRGAPLRAAPNWAETAAALAVLALLLASRKLADGRLRGMLVATVFVGYCGGASFVYVHHGIVISMIYVIMAFVLGFIVMEYHRFSVLRGQKRQIAKTFGDYVPTELIDEMANSGRASSVGGESRESAVLVAKVEDATGARRDAALTRIAGIVAKHRGCIDTRSADAFAASWGTLDPDPECARNAVLAALEMAATVTATNAGSREEPIAVAIGVTTGPVNVAMVGSAFHLAVTMPGDMTGLALRLRTLTKERGVMVIVSQFVRESLPDLTCRDLGIVPGKEAIAMFEPVAFVTSRARERVGK